MKNNRRKGRKPRKSRNTNRSAPLVPRPFLPRVQYVQMSYTGAFSLVEAAAGVGAYRTFRTNDIYDPDFTGVGSSAIGFAQWMALYTRFKVVAYTARVDIANITSPSPGAPVVAGLYATYQSTLPATTYSWPSQPYCKSTQLSLPASGSAAAKFVTRVKPWSTLGLTKSQYIDEIEFSGTNAASPIRSTYLHVFIYNNTGVVGVASCNIVLNFVVEVSQPVNVA